MQRCFLLSALLLGCAHALKSIALTSGIACSESMGTCMDAKFPSTTLTTLIDNGIVTLPPSDGATGDAVERVYYRDNLQYLTNTSDIYANGYDYSMTYKPNYDDAYESLLDGEDGDKKHVVLLKIRGAGQRVVVEDQGSNEVLEDSTGMWKNREIDVTGHFLDRKLDHIAIKTFPPKHYGKVSSQCVESDGNCGQGGNHEMAREAGTLQFAAGWDWSQGIPDRVSGIWDSLTLESRGYVRATSPALQALWIKTGGDGDGNRNNSARVRVSVNMVSASGEHAAKSGVLNFKIGEEVRSLHNFTIANGEVKLASIDFVIDDVKLWWPHTLGEPNLYACEVEFVPHASAYRSDSVQWLGGVRQIRTDIDQTTKGRAFYVNGVKIFLQGGNWIATDCMLQRGGRERYYNEVLLHKFSGMNMIRVWGGSLAERPEFYRAADKLGMLVMQEFGMTGDNNGRWGGDVDWPEDQQNYLNIATDVVLMLRQHPSLMFWCGGNELYSDDGGSPPDYIQWGLRYITSWYDDRFLIMSSMDGGVDGMDMSKHDDNFALVAKDGPYVFLDIERYYSEANPGMLKVPGEIVSFQPEIGASSFPRMRGLERMGLAQDGVFPKKYDVDVPLLWDYHKFEGYAFDKGDSRYDSLYAYGAPKNVSEYAARANLACAQQYQALFEGFTRKMFKDASEGGKSAILLWKSQSPWPALRGFLYDWWLQGVGTLDGVRAGLGSGSSKVQLDLATGRIDVINRGRTALKVGKDAAVSVDMFGYDGAKRSAQLVEFGQNDFNGIVKPTSVASSKESVSWAGLTDEVLFVRLTCPFVEDKETWYWLRRTDEGTFSVDYEELGEWREQGPHADIAGSFLNNSTASNDDNDDDDGWWTSSLKLKVSGPAVMFAPSFEAFDEAGDIILPLLVESKFVVLNDGKEVTLNVKARRRISTMAVDHWASGGSPTIITNDVAATTATK